MLNYITLKANLSSYQLVLDVNIAVQVSLIIDLVKKVEFGWGGVGLGGDGGGGVLGHNHVKPNSVELS